MYKLDKTMYLLHANSRDFVICNVFEEFQVATRWARRQSKRVVVNIFRKDLCELQTVSPHPSTVLLAHMPYFPESERSPRVLWGFEKSHQDLEIEAAWFCRCQDIACVEYFEGQEMCLTSRDLSLLKWSE